MSTITKSSRSDFLEDCKDILTEGIFNHRWALLQCYHSLGQRILEEKNVEDSIRLLTQEIPHLKLRTVQRAVQFAKKFPSLDKLPDGKNCSWSKVCNLYLPEPTQKNGWSWRLLDTLKIRPDFLQPDRKKINQAVEEMGKEAERKIGGIEVFRED